MAEASPTDRRCIRTLALAEMHSGLTDQAVQRLRPLVAGHPEDGALLAEALGRHGGEPAIREAVTFLTRHLDAGRATGSTFHAALEAVGRAAGLADSRDVQGELEALRRRAAEIPQDPDNARP